MYICTYVHTFVRYLSVPSRESKITCALRFPSSACFVAHKKEFELFTDILHYLYTYIYVCWGNKITLGQVIFVLLIIV